MLSAIIVTHGRLAEVLRDAAASIAGDASGVEVLSNDGLAAEPLLATLRAAVARTGGAGCIIFTDLGGGSCATASLLALRDAPQVRLVTGVNLPMLVDFLLRRNDLDLDALVTRLVQRGHASIQELHRS
jgi:PTS system mannose-specific IIA component